jgi:hypothetical protein
VLAVSNVLSAYLCDLSAARRFIGFTAVITAEARRTAEIRIEEPFANYSRFKLRTRAHFPFFCLFLGGFFLSSSELSEDP